MQFRVGKELFESSFNFYSLDYANTQVLEGKSEEPITVYNSLLTYNKFESLIDALLFIFGPKKNGGINKNKILQGLEELEENGTDIDELIDSVIAEFEESGFFVKTIRTTNRLMKLTLDEMEKKKLSTSEKIEMAEVRKQLVRAEEKGLI